MWMCIQTLNNGYEQYLLKLSKSALRNSPLLIKKNLEGGYISFTVVTIFVFADFYPRILIPDECLCTECLQDLLTDIRPYSLSVETTLASSMH